MEESINLNPFKSTHFAWIDFSIIHVAQNSEKIHEWINCIPDKIKQLCINPFIENEEHKTFFRYIYHHTAGGLFTGSKEYLLKYCELFKQKTEQIYNEDWYQIDEAVMTIVQRENEDLFDFFYGDYQGIISNYNYPVHNIELIMIGIKKCINANEKKRAYEILCYCNKYFEKNYNTNEYVYEYVYYHIILDYYYNNCLLVPDVIKIIKLLREHNKYRIDGLLEYNSSNIDFYKNKEEILV